LRCAHDQAGAIQPPHVAGTQEEPPARRAHQRDSKSQPQRPRTFGQSHLQFRGLLRDPDWIQRQDAIIKIPMILFFQCLLCTLPHEMIREEMVTSYLSALTNLDAAMCQTVEYAMYNLMTALQKKFTAPLWIPAAG